MWTKEQQMSIDAPVSDVLVTAAAGSGKTAVMVERLIQRVIAPEGTDIDRMLVVTFTKAAASEIKERIASKISEKLAEGDNPRLKNQLVLVNRASICTIHSFCLDILKENFHLLGLDPNFKVGDTTELAILKSKAMGDVLDRYYDAEDETFLRVINSFTKKRDDAIENIIGSIYDFAQSAPDPEAYLDDCCKVYSGDCDAQLSYILGNAADTADYAAECYRKAQRLCLTDKSFEKALGVISEELDFAENISNLCNKGWDDVYVFVNGHKFSSLRSNKDMDMSVFDEIKSLRDKGKECLKSIIADKVNLPIDTIKEDLLYMQPCVEMLCQLVKEFSETYRIYKRDKNIVDFNDIEHLALKLLTSEENREVAESCRERFDEIYIDEYQDCNGVQEALFKAISQEKSGRTNMFMVGDMKQCIYRFRNANPMLFKHKSDTYTLGTNGDYNKIILSKNFRSRDYVINCVNLIFSRIMSENVGGIEYSAEEYLYKGADYDDTNDDMQYIDLCIIDSSATDDEEEEKPIAVMAEAELVARKIRALKESNYTVYDKSADMYRPIKYRDIAILLRGVSGNGEYFADALANSGIPAYCDSGVGYFECEEVNMLISFIKVISNPLDDINLVSVMRGPVYGFNDNDLLSIRTADRKGYFYDAVVKYSRGEEPLSFKIRKFLKDLDEYRLKASILSVDEFLWYLMEKTGYMEYISALSGAATRKANVRTFINRAHIYVSNTGGDISGFAEYVDDITMSGGDGQGAKLIGENDDVVRIMTIHKSKGLEFPVVFLSQCGKRFNMRDTAESVLMHHDLGLGIDYVDEKKRFAYSMAVKNAIKDKIMEENLSEEMRLLYVALTRAREKLFITGVVNDYVKFMEGVREECSGVDGKLHSRIISSGRTYLSWVVRALYEDDNNPCRSISGGGFVRREITSIYSLVPELCEGKNDAEIPSFDETSEYKGEILRRLDYEYPHAALSRLPRNVTVTEIKRIFDNTDEYTFRLYRMPDLKKPSFLGTDAKPDAAHRGTLMHLCMEKIKLTDGVNHDTIKETIVSMVSEGIITSAESESIDSDAISGFFESSVGKAMLDAREVYREVPFEILVDADDIFRGVGTAEKIVVQGMIDAYFIDNDDNVVLVDYKTDKNRCDSVEEFKELIIRRYQSQLHYYERALELLTGRAVHGKYVYLFDIGEAVEIH
ncbi:MAG: helicase-exonuclease AddAB subunit AddA [Clostridia bacterium]|nr:helicase-exonuclease AddAB subunit AddA [Clostridia bacterium]